MPTHVTAVVLAAGQSTRMGRTKQTLPWGDTTVLGQTLRNLRQSGVAEILVVTGHEANAVATVAAAHDVPTVHNPHYAAGGMLSSLQVAVRRLPPHCDAVLVVLADQPMVAAATIDRLLDAYAPGRGDIVAPTYQGRRGNPVLIGRRYFDELLALPQGEAPRALLKRHGDDLHLVEVDSGAILQDVDRPEEYRRHRPGPSP